MCGVAVGDRGGGDDDGEQQAVHLPGEVPLDAVGFLAAIPAAAGSGHGVGGGYRLRVDDRRARAPVPPGPHPQSVAPRVEDAATPAGEDRGHRRGWRELHRQLPPPDTTAHDIQDGGTITRRQSFSGRPPRPAVLPGAGNSSSRIAHSASVTDDEYTAQPCPPAAWGGHDGQGEIGDDGIVGSWSGRGLGITDPPEPHTRPSRVLKHSLRCNSQSGPSAGPAAPNHLCRRRSLRAVYRTLRASRHVILPNQRAERIAAC